MSALIPSDLTERPLYLERVQPFIGKGLIKVFTGQRRVGKSYLLFQVMDWVSKEDKDADIIYINKEDLAFDFIKNAGDLHDYVLAKRVKGKMAHVFIDEIQDIENFGQALRSLLLQTDIDIYCTGSNANLLSGDIAGLLSGRFIEFSVYSLSYPEFIRFHNLQNTNESVELYMKYGGLPYLKHLPLVDHVIYEYLKNIYTTIVYRDIVNRYSIRNTKFLEQLTQFLAGNIGSLFSAKKISDYLKSQQINIPPNQVQTYIGHLMSAFIIHQAKRYDIKGKRVFESNEKYYFENLGIRNGIWGYRLEDRGKIIENVVYNHLLFKGFNVKVGVLPAGEIDFIGEKEGETMYIQVALNINEEKTLQREFGNLSLIDDNYPKKVIGMDNFKGNSYQGIEYQSLFDFLNS